MRKKHLKTLDAIFKRPTQSGIKWADIESLFSACGAYIEEREGSRVYVELNNRVGHFHRPYPGKEARKGVVDAVRRFLKEAGINR
ncbi:MAG: type II toxin-antitoxin system HicA family toxin [Acidobacteriota bacterium]|nr:type II toxin-antitoxin system HicA family toxin [Acidobacteriota bacterium]